MRIALTIVLPLAGLVLGWLTRWLYARIQLSSTEQKAARLLQEAEKDAESKKKEALLEGRDRLIRERNQLERETRERRAELQRMERRLLQKEEGLDKRGLNLDGTEQTLGNRERALTEKEQLLEQERQNCRTELERISGLSGEEAKHLLMEGLENEARRDAQVSIGHIEQEAQRVAEKKARDVLVGTMQRIASDVTSEVTVTTVSLPNDEMKGRIIGREGRNIRTLETLTGVDIIIDDTPEAVVISCFDPVRKEIAKQALERLVADGRIHPARIEEVVQKTTREIERTIYEEGERTLAEFNIHNLHPEGVRALGRLHFRTSYGQNQLAHSREVARIAVALAAELHADTELAKRAALLHDVGKGVESNTDANHTEISVEIAKKIGESPAVINCIAAHHQDTEPNCVEAVILQIADTISASRPGARQDTLENYITRLENLEKIATGFDGVDKAYAIQAGRELRIIVNNDRVDDVGAKELARRIARKIEDELKYPGRIKVTTIRETRIVEYAR
jgi:ribonucrease Y